MLFFSLLLVNSQLLWNSLTNNFRMPAEDFEPNCNHKWPTSSEINLAKFNEF